MGHHARWPVVGHASNSTLQTPSKGAYVVLLPQRKEKFQKETLLFLGKKLSFKVVLLLFFRV